MVGIKKNSGGVKDAEAVAKEPRVFANLTLDAGFKIVFGTEGASEGLLMRLLSRLLPEVEIKELQYLPTEHFVDSEEGGKAAFDVYCTDRSGTRFLVEMQMWTQHCFNKRAVYYASRSVLDQARMEKKYQREKLNRKWDYHFSPVFVVCFLNFANDLVSGADAEEHMSHYVFRSLSSGRPLGDNVNLIFVDLYRFTKEYADCMDLKEKWLYSLKNMHLLQEQPKDVEGTELEELYQMAYMDPWSSEKKDKYRQHMTREDEIMNSMREQREDAYKEGREEGKALAKKEDALKLRQLGVSVDVISQATGLPVDIINNL